MPAGATVKLSPARHGRPGLHLHGERGGRGRRGAGGAGGSGATTYSFVLKQPDAKLYDQSNTQVGTHGAGPNWTSTVDASVVNGAKVWQENSPTAGAIPWLLLRATSNTGTGVFSDITYVHAREHDRGRGARDRLRRDDGRHGHAGQPTRLTTTSTMAADRERRG